MPDRRTPADRLSPRTAFLRRPRDLPAASSRLQAKISKKALKTSTLSYDIAVSELSGWKSAVLLAHCALARSVPGGCGWCGTLLPRRRRRWCAPACGDDFWRNHWWPMARRAAKRRDRWRCVRCDHAPAKRPAGGGSTLRAWRSARRKDHLEVNHRMACLGRHASLSCSHHLDNLETLCVPCHAEHTRSLPR